MSDDWKKAAANWQNYKTIRQQIEELLSRIPDYPSWETYGLQSLYDPRVGQAYTLDEYLKERYPDQLLQGEVEPVAGPIEEAVYMLPAGWLTKASLGSLLGGVMPTGLKEAAANVLSSQAGRLGGSAADVVIPKAIKRLSMPELEQSVKFFRPFVEQRGHTWTGTDFPGMFEALDAWRRKHEPAYREWVRRTTKATTEKAKASRSNVSSKSTPREATPVYPGLNVKAVLGDDLLQRIATEGYNEEIRKEILSRLAFTEARKELLNKVAPHIEKVAKEAGPGTRGYLYGSIVSTKPKLGDLVVGKKGDVDLAIIDPKVAMRDTTELMKAAEEALPSGLQTMIFGTAGKHRPPYGAVRKSALQTAVESMRRRYPGSEMIRLWSGAPTGIGLIEYLDEVE